MRPNTIIAIVAIVALMIGAFMLYASADLLSNMNPDPHDRHCDYTVTGNYGDGGLNGTATCDTINESGAFYNYQIKIAAKTDEGTPFSDSFLVIFDDKEIPQFFAKESVDSEGLVTYVQDSGSKILRIVVSDLCLITGFDIAVDGCIVHGTLNQ